jgi:hypothetical protein
LMLYLLGEKKERKKMEKQPGSFLSPAGHRECALLAVLHQDFPIC